MLCELGSCYEEEFGFVKWVLYKEEKLKFVRIMRDTLVEMSFVFGWSRNGVGVGGGMTRVVIV